MNLNLGGKVVLVTGSSKGIGRSIASALFEEGCKVVLNARSLDELALTEASLPGSKGFVADVTIP